MTALAVSSAALPQFRVVHFVVNPAAGYRIPVAVVVRQPDGSTESVALPRVPGPECLGNRRAYSLLNMVKPHLGRLCEFDKLPKFLGPHFELSTPKEVPERENWRSWVTGMVFPPLDTDSPKKARASRRATLGRHWMERHGISELVANRYKIHEGVSPITHWTQTPSGLLLMEPLSPNREAFDDDLTEANTRLRAAFTYIGDDSDTVLAAYLLEGFDDKRKRQITEIVHDVADIYDLTDQHCQQKLVRLIRTAADQQSAPV